MRGGQDHDPRHDDARADEERHVDVERDDQPPGHIRRQPAADEPDEAVGGRGDRALDRRDGHDGLGGDRVVDADEDPGHDHGRDQHRVVGRPHRDDQHDHGERGEVAVHGPRQAEPGLQPGRAEDREQRDQDAPAGEDQPEPDRAQVHRERRVAEHGEEAPVVTQRRQRQRQQAAVRAAPAAARTGRSSALAAGSSAPARWWRSGRSPSGPTTPKNGPRQLILPSTPPSSGPSGDAHAQGGLVQHDRAGEAAAGRGDDHRERGRDEQRVADAPAGPEADDAADRGRGAGQRARRPRSAPARRSASSWPRSGWTPSS